MRLVELSANKPSFHTVRFNRRGLTLVVGSRTDGGSTYNGVGKSLIVELLHFCLGSNRNEEFQRKLPDWEFSLEFELGDEGNTHVVRRSTTRQEIVHLNNSEIRNTQFVEWLEGLTFSIPSGIEDLSFRSLIPFFLRRGLKDYVDPRVVGYMRPYDLLLRNGFLLGVDTHLIVKKHEQRQEKERIKKLRKNFKDDPLLRQFYLGASDAGIHLSFLETRLKSLETARDAFVVAENYYDLQRAADDLASKIERAKNDAFLLRSAIQNIDESLRQQPAARSTQVSALYEKLRAAFREEALKRLDEVAAFHARLLTNRTTRLSSEKVRLQGELAFLDEALKKDQQDLDKRLRFLGEARALDQYTALVNEIAEITAQIQKLRDYKAIDVEYSNRDASITAEMGADVIRANAYLEDTREHHERVFSLFRSFVRSFYPTVPAGITLNTNAGDNQTRFDLDVKIENDSSDGINEVRIFCYDLVLVSLRQCHHIDFLFHDSRLFANMDVRQRATLFRLAAEQSEKRDFQYIATLNPDEVTGMQSEFSPEEFARTIASHVVLELKDDSPAGKLLGIQVDISYDAR